MGYIAFALGIIISIGLHEYGHMKTALACGMKVRRFYIGFGPTLFKFTRPSGIEYGLKIFPFGGFCDIAGMTNLDDEADKPYAMVHKKWWQRIIVLSGGVAANILVGFLLLYSVAVGAGLPNPHADYSARIGSVMADQPAAAAGLEPGDVITAVNGQTVNNFSELRNIINENASQQVSIDIERNGSSLERVISITDQGTIGIVSAPVTDAVKKYNPIEAIPATARLTGDILDASVRGLLSFPSKIPGVAQSIAGEERAQDSPMSVVGATRIGGQGNWAFMFLLLASLNFFLALFNLVPIPPLDGGHIAVVIYEKLRNLIRGRDLGPVDYAKVLPIIWAFSALLLLIGLITITADIVNPIRIR